MPETTYRCPHCHAEFAVAEGFAAHLRDHPDCWAHASLARSLAAAGVRLCPRCRLGILNTAYAHWATDGFVHLDCLTPNERAGLMQAPSATDQVPR